MSEQTQASSKTLIIGVGNTLRRDDGVGVHVVRWLQERYGETAEASFIDVGTLGLTLAGLIEDAEVFIVIDAAQLDAAPGTVRVFENEEMDRLLTAHRRISMHELSLIDLLALTRLRERLPPRRALIGIQPQALDWGEQPTAAVARAIPEAGAIAMALVRRWCQ